MPEFIGFLKYVRKNYKAIIASAIAIAAGATYFTGYNLTPALTEVEKVLDAAFGEETNSTYINSTTHTNENGVTTTKLLFDENGTLYDDRETK